MARILRRDRRPRDLPHTPLADLAFLLIIFFICATLCEAGQEITLLLPGVDGRTVRVNPRDVMCITTDASNNVYIDGRRVQISQVKDVTEAKLAENEELVVSIESHPDSRYGAMIAVLDQVKLAKPPSISLRIKSG